MTGIDIFVSIICAIMLFGGLYLNLTSRKLADQYAVAHRPEAVISKAPVQKSGKVQKK